MSEQNKLDPGREEKFEGGGEQEKEEQKIKKWQQGTLKFLKRHGFELSPADAVVLRDVVRETYYDNKKLSERSLDFTTPLIEGVARWLFHQYKIDINEILSSHAIFPISWDELAKLIKKYREEKELI